MGSYYIVKLNYPEASTDDEREYKWKESGKWKKYDKNGILLVKPEYKDEIITSDGIKVTDKDGKEVIFTDHYYLLDVPMSELMENLFMRWDTGKIGAPKIYVNPKTEPTREVEVNISYPSGVMQKLYKIVTPDGKDTGWLVNNGTFTVTDNNAVVYAKGVSINKTDSEVASVKITNIDDEAPVIKYAADLTNPKQKVTVKVTVKDNMLIDKIKWSEGEQAKEYFETSGNSIVNNGTFTVTKNGKYTIYAVDSLGNATVEVIEVTNIDKNAPKIAIDVLTKEYGTTAKVSIDYGDSSIKEYSLGNNTTYKTYTDVIEILANDVLNLVNPDGTLTIYARGTDEAGNITEVSEIIYVLDLDAPAAPIIHAASGYPTLTEYGVKLTDKSYIIYDNRNDILNYYSTDNGTTWKIYEGPFEISSGTILAKSVKKVSGLTITSSKKVIIPDDAIGVNAYDDNSETAFSGYYSDTKYSKIVIDETVLGESLSIKTTGNANRFYFYDENLKLIGSEIQNPTTITIPENAAWMYYAKYRGGSTSALYEMTLITKPQINVIKQYSILEEYGVVPGYNEIAIDYYRTSTTRLYKINDGEWEEYQDKKIRIELNDVIYTKGIDKYGKETPVSSHKGVLPTDAIGVNAYDGNTSTNYSGNYTDTMYSKLRIDSNIRGQKITVTTTGNANRFYFYDENLKLIGSEIQNPTTMTIPTNAAWMYYAKYRGGSTSYLAEITIVTQPTINVTKYYPRITNKGIQKGYNEATIKYYQTGVQCLYKINDGDWVVYDNNKIHLNLNDTLYAKGIDKYNKETPVSSYKAVLPSDAFGSNAYDGNASTSYQAPFSDTSYSKIIVDETAIGATLSISANGNANRYWFYTSELKQVGSVLSNPTSITIPEGTAWIYYARQRGGSTSNLYEITLKKAVITSDEELGETNIYPPHISINTTALSDEKTISIEYPEGYTNEYSLDLGNTWLPYEGTITIDKSSVILARTMKGDEIISSSSFTVTSINNKKESEEVEEEINISLEKLPERIIVGSDYKLPTSVTGKEYTCTTNNEVVDNTKDLIVGNYDIICTVKSSSGAEKTISKQIEVYKEETDEIEGEENE